MRTTANSAPNAALNALVGVHTLAGVSKPCLSGLQRRCNGILNPTKQSFCQSGRAI